MVIYLSMLQQSVSMQSSNNSNHQKGSKESSFQAGLSKRKPKMNTLDFYFNKKQAQSHRNSHNNVEKASKNQKHDRKSRIDKMVDEDDGKGKVERKRAKNEESDSMRDVSQQVSIQQQVQIQEELQQCVILTLQKLKLYTFLQIKSIRLHGKRLAFEAQFQHLKTKNLVIMLCLDEVMQQIENKDEKLYRYDYMILCMTKSSKVDEQ